MPNAGRNLREFQELADVFTNEAGQIVVKYDEFWETLLLFAQTYVRWVSSKISRKIQKDKLAKLAELMSNSKNVNARYKVGMWLRPTRELVYESAVKILKYHDDNELQKLVDDYKNKVVKPLVEQNKDWVYSYLHRHGWNAFDGDVVSSAFEGFLTAIHKFDFNSKKSLTTFSSFWIYESIYQDFIRRMYHIKVPIAERIRETKIKNQRRRMGETNKTLEEEAPDLHNAINVIPLSKRMRADDSVDRLEDFVKTGSTGNDPMLHVYEQDIERILETKLSYQENMIFRRFVGYKCEKHSKQQLSRMFGISTQKVNAIIERSIKKLKTQDFKELLMEVISIRHNDSSALVFDL